MNKIYDVYLCRKDARQEYRNDLGALWDMLAADYNKAMSEVFKQRTLRNGHLDFNKKIIGEA